MSSIPYINPLSPVQIGGTISVPRDVNYGVVYSTNLVGGYMEVERLNDLIYTIPSGTSGLTQFSGNSIPISFVKGNGTVYSPDVLFLNNDNISSGRRKLGMLVFVREQNQIYQYNIDGYETLWNSATAATGTVEISYLGTTVNNTSAAGQNFINSWTASTIDGVGGYTVSNARWKKYYGTNLALTGGSFNSITGTLTLTNITGGTQSLTGFGSGGGGGAGITGGTFNQNTLDLNLTSSAGTITINGVTGLYITGGTYSASTSTILLYNSTGGTINITGITASGGGGVTTTGGTYSAGTATFTNSTGGTFSVTGFSKYFVTGSTPTNVILNNGDRWFDTNTGIEVVWITDVDGSQWIQPTQGGGSSTGGPSITGGTYNQNSGSLSLSNSTGGTVNINGQWVYVTGGTYSSGIIYLNTNTGGTTTITGIVGGTGSPSYITKWSSSSDIYDSRLYDDGTFLGLDITGPTYGEAVSLQTSNRGILIDDTYIIQTGGNSLAFTIGYDYSSWGSNGELAIGTRGPLLNSTGSGNIAIGDKALATNTTGNDNIAIGSTGALFKNDTGNENLSIGRFALTNNIVGSNNIALGTESLFNNNSNRNIAIGSYAGYSNTNYDKNIYIGHSAGYSNDGESNIFIGYGAGSSETTTNNKLIIGDTIYGDLGTKFVGINQPTPVVTLDVGGDTNVTGGITANTIYATTYYNLPIDVRVTSASYSNNTFTFTNNTGGTFSVLFNTVTGLTVNGSLRATTISATTYQNLPFSGTVVGNGTANYIPKWTGTTGFGNSVIYETNSRIGIGTISPNALLDILTTGSTVSGLIVSGNTTTGRDMVRITQTGAGNAFVVEDSSNPDATPFVIDSLGEVGIGTDSPIALLHVSGNSIISGTLTGSTILATTFSGGTDTISSSKGNVVTDGDPTRAFITISGSNTNGGVDVVDFIRVINASPAATNSNKFFTVDKVGSFLIYNSAYNNAILSLTNSGSLTVTDSSTIGGNLTVNGVLTVTGNTSLRALTATTISATTYQNLPTDVRVTGATYSNNTFTYTNNTGGTFNVLFNTVTGLTVNGNLSVTGTTTSPNFSGNSDTISGTKGQVITNGNTSTAFLNISGSNTVGGASYVDFLRVTNNSVGATNPTKTIRVNNTGGMEFLNSAYTALTLTIGDNGALFVGGGNAATTSSTDGVTNYLNFNNNNSQIYDDGNLHIHSRAANQAMWVNTNNGAMYLLTQSPLSGGAIGTGIGIATTTLIGYVTINTGKTYTTSAAYGYLTTAGAGTYPGGSQTVSISLYATDRVWAQEFDAFSDERMKNIQGTVELDEALKLVNDLKPIKYTWKEGDDKGLKVGYSAQQVSKAGFDHLIGVLPKEGLEETIDEDGFVSPKDTQFSMNYEQVTPYHGVVIKHLLEEIEKLKEEIKELKNKVV